MFKDLIALIFDAGYEYIRDGYKFEVSFPWANSGEEQKYNILALTISKRGYTQSVSFTEEEVCYSYMTSREYIEESVNNMIKELNRHIYCHK